MQAPHMAPLARGRAQTVQQLRGSHGRSAVHGAHSVAPSAAAPQSTHACGQCARTKSRQPFRNPAPEFDTSAARAEDTSDSNRWIFPVLIDGATWILQELTNPRLLPLTAR